MIYQNVHVHLIKNYQIQTTSTHLQSYKYYTSIRLQSWNLQIRTPGIRISVTSTSRQPQYLHILSSNFAIATSKQLKKNIYKEAMTELCRDQEAIPPPGF